MARVVGSYVANPVIGSHVWGWHMTSSSERLETELGSCPSHCFLHFITHCHERDIYRDRSILYTSLFWNSSLFLPLWNATFIFGFNMATPSKGLYSENFEDGLHLRKKCWVKSYGKLIIMPHVPLFLQAWFWELEWSVLTPFNHVRKSRKRKECL